MSQNTLIHEMKIKHEIVSTFRIRKTEYVAFDRLYYFNS